HERSGEVHLEMAVRVPRERADPVTLLQAKARQSGGQPADPIRVVGIGVAPQPAARHPRGQRLSMEEPAGPLEELRQGERVVHDEALHRAIGPPGRGRWDRVPYDRGRLRALSTHRPGFGSGGSPSVPAVAGLRAARRWSMVVAMKSRWDDAAAQGLSDLDLVV